MDARHVAVGPFTAGMAVGSISTGLLVFVVWLAASSSRNAPAIVAAAAVVSSTVAVVTMIRGQLHSHKNGDGPSEDRA